MSNIGNPTRTDGAAPSRIDARMIATVIAAVLFTVLLISFRPFQPTGALASQDSAPLESGDIVNQVGYLSLGMLAIFGMAGYAEPRKLLALLSPWWLLLFGFLAISVYNATDAASGRAAIFSLLAIVSAAAVVVLPRDADAFSEVIAFAGLSVVVLSYIGLVVVPDLAVHTPGEVEADLAGLWRGLFSHKNVAGPVMACCSFGGLYLWRRGWNRSGVVLFLGAMIFVVNTGSKTTAALVPLSIILVMGPGLIGMRLLSMILVAIAFVVTGLVTAGFVFIEPINRLGNEFFPGLDYTGRTSLWIFSGEMIAKQPWFGYGYLSFWGAPIVRGQDVFFDAPWDIRGSVHGHEGYMDIAVQMGLPAMIVAVMTFVVVPMRDFMRTPLYKENIFLADFFMMIIQFTTLNAFLESFFLRRADPVWMCLVIGLLGLRIVSRFPIPSRVASGPQGP